MTFYSTKPIKYGTMRLSLPYQPFINLGSHFRFHEKWPNTWTQIYTYMCVYMQTQIYTHTNKWKPTCTKHTFSHRLHFKDIWLRQQLTRQWTMFIFSGASLLQPVTMKDLFFLGRSWSCCENIIANECCMPRKAMHFIPLPLPPHLLFFFHLYFHLPEVEGSQIPGVISKPCPSLSHIENHSVSPVKVFFLNVSPVCSLLLFSIVTALIQCLTFSSFYLVPPILKCRYLCRSTRLISPIIHSLHYKPPKWSVWTPADREDG